MVLLAGAARHCLPNNTLFHLMKWQKIVSQNDNVSTPNSINSETKILTDQYAKKREKTDSGEVIFLNFAEKLKDNEEMYIK